MHPSVTGSSYARLVAGEETLHVQRGLDLPLSEITWRATTSGGPGGQHANRTLSRGGGQFDVAASPTLGPRPRGRPLGRLGPGGRAGAAGGPRGGAPPPNPRPRPGGPAGPDADAADEELAGAPGRIQAAARRDQ